MDRKGDSRPGRHAFRAKRDPIMAITYEVLNGGHFIHAIASGEVSSEEFIQYEIDHAIDKRIKSPVAELFLIKPNACKHITQDDMRKILERRRAIERPPTPHACAILVSSEDVHAWRLAKFYEGMVTLHYPESVIVFGDEHTARIWLGVEPTQGH